jgi:galactokinase
MTGAGFGGCAMALIKAQDAEDFVRHTAGGYEKQTGHKPAVYVCQATNGAEVV